MSVEYDVTEALLGPADMFAAESTAFHVPVMAARV